MLNGKSQLFLLLKRRLHLQAEFDLISAKEVECLLLRSRGYGRLLAHQLRSQAASRLIPSIKNTDGIITTDPLEIN